VVPIQTVFLDAGGVLVNPNWQRVSDVLAQHGVTASSAALAAAEPRAKKRLDTGETIRATNDQQRGWTYFNLVLTEAGVPLSDATAAALAELYTYHQTHNLWETVPDEVRPALAALRSRGFRLVVLSNANGTLHRAFDRLGLTAAFDVIFDSHNEGVEKPDPRFFQIALERSGAVAETTMHVGDLYHVDVAGARAAGLTPALVDVGGLYTECDCLRVRSLSELVEAIGYGGHAGPPLHG
jgi:HAD superfamily hydrolase (TIGR01509 family)